MPPHTSLCSASSCAACYTPRRVWRLLAWPFGRSTCKDGCRIRRRRLQTLRLRRRLVQQSSDRWYRVGNISTGTSFHTFTACWLKVNVRRISLFRSFFQPQGRNHSTERLLGGRGEAIVPLRFCGIEVWLLGCFLHEQAESIYFRGPPCKTFDTPKW